MGIVFESQSFIIVKYFQHHIRTISDACNRPSLTVFNGEGRPIHYSAGILPCIGANSGYFYG